MSQIVTIKPSPKLKLIDNTFKFKIDGLGKEKIRLPRVIRRYGGKGSLYHLYEPFIRSLASRAGASVFVDAFGGGGSMSIAALLMDDFNTYKPLFNKVVYNDIEIGAATTFKVVKNWMACNELVDRVLLTEYSEENFNKAHEVMQSITLLGKQYIESSGISDIDIAYYNIIESCMSFNSIGESYRDYLTEVCDFNSIDYEQAMWRQAEGLLEVTPFLERMEVHNGSYEKIINQYKNQRCVYLLDPPYFHDTRATSTGYKFEFSDEQHAQLLELVTGYKFVTTKREDGRTEYIDLLPTGDPGLHNWIICGYDRSAQNNQMIRMYELLVEKVGIQKIDLGVHSRPSSNKEMRDTDPHEIAWIRW